MPDAPNGQGQGTVPPDQNTAPAAPETPPDAGQGGGGQGDGQGDQQGHQLDPNLTRAQQEAAEAKREADALREQLESIQRGSNPQQGSDQQEDPDLAVFDKYAGKSKVLQQQMAAMQNAQIVAMDTQMQVRAQDFPHYSAVRDKVVAELRQMGPLPAEHVDRAMKMVYANHASPIVNQRDQALLTENQTLKARLAALEGRASQAGIDVGALQQTGDQGGGTQEPTPPAADAPASEWAAYIDAMNAHRSG